MNIDIVQAISILTNFILLILLVFYFFYLRVKEKALNSKENKLDVDYHRTMDETLAKERKILEDSATEAGQIIAGAQFISDETKKSLDQTLAKMVYTLEQGTVNTSQQFVKYYFDSLSQMTHQSLTGFAHITKDLETDLHTQLKQYQASLLPTVQKEIESYKQSRMKEIDQSVKVVVQKVSREVLNKTIAMEDHEKLVLETLEKAKAEGVFD